MKYLQWFRVKILILLLLGVCVISSYAQLPGTSNTGAQNQRETARLERHYEVQLKNALSNYYNKNSFLVDANVDLREVRVPNTFRRSTQREEPLNLETLPGLPILPEGFSRTVDEDTVRADEFRRALQISQKSVRVIVDTSYTSSDIDFVEELVRSEANLEATRGDIVTISERVFPRSKNELTANEEASTQREPPVNPQDTVSANADSLNESSDEAGFFSLQNPDLLWYIIYGLIAFILILALALFLSGRRKSNEDDEDETERTPSNEEAFNQLKAEIQSLKDEDETDEEEQPEITPEREALFEKDRSYITNQYISHPQKVADLLEKWITDDEDDGVLKAAKAVKGGNPKLLTTLRPTLKREHFDALQYCLEDMNPMSLHEQMKQARKFRQKLQDSLNGEESEESDHDMFGFINQLTDDQILHLFKDETDDMIAIALAQLDGDRAANILQLLDENRRTSILVKMGNINDLSIDAYKEVANHFSEKALKIINMRHVAADGVQSILQLIDTLPVDQQEQYVQSIAETDLELAKKVREYFVGFSDIPEVEDNILEEVLNELETETLILALKGADEEIYNTIMGFRPSREQRLIKSEIETRTDVETSEIDEARKTLLREIRNKVKRD